MIDPKVLRGREKGRVPGPTYAGPTTGGKAKVRKRTSKQNAALPKSKTKK